ncbi:MAG: hypothetical protein QW596_03665 [Sulfolobales archaeon]
MIKLRLWIHPITGLAVIIWVMISLYLSYTINAFILSLISLLLLTLSQKPEQTRKLIMLYAWVAIPPYILLTIIYGLLEATDITIRLLTITMTFTSTLQLIKPIELAYISSKLGLPAFTALSIPMVLKLADYLSHSVSETIVAMKGRGLNGRKLLLNLPIPLIIHSVNSSASLAESLVQKRFKKIYKLHGGPSIGFTDVIMISYIALNVVLMLTKLFYITK